MGQPKSIIHVHITLSDGTCLDFNDDEIEPGAHYSTSRNFNNPPRKQVKGEPKTTPETWIQHNVHFVTNRETKETWEQRNINVT